MFKKKKTFLKFLFTIFSFLSRWSLLLNKQKKITTLISRPFVRNIKFFSVRLLTEKKKVDPTNLLPILVLYDESVIKAKNKWRRKNEKKIESRKKKNWEQVDNCAQSNLCLTGLCAVNWNIFFELFFLF